MNIEIERKFLVIGDFMPSVQKTEKIAQGYLCASYERTVRVRIKGNLAFITIKGPSNENGFSRAEYEYSIPLTDAEEMLKLCNTIIEKERHYVPVGNHLYEVDVFHGIHEGLVIAELELQSEEETFEKPSWLGKEVTGDKRYYNAYLSQNNLPSF